MELKYKGSFKRDFNINNQTIVKAVYEAVINIKTASNISKINDLKKLKKYSVHYRIKIAENYRLGIIIRKNTVYFVRIGHRSSFYKYFP